MSSLRNSWAGTGWRARLLLAGRLRRNRVHGVPGAIFLPPVPTDGQVLQKRLIRSRLRMRGLAHPGYEPQSPCGIFGQRHERVGGQTDPTHKTTPSCLSRVRLGGQDRP